MRNRRTAFCLKILLVTLILACGPTLVRAQGGTGKLPPPKLPPPQRKMPLPKRNPTPERTPDLKISERRVRDIIVLDLDGKITAREGGTVLRNAIRRLIREARKKILLNLAKVGSIDATEAEEMASTHGSVEKDGGQLKLCSLTSKVRDQIDRLRTSTSKVFLMTDTFDNEQEALVSFR